MIEPHDIDSRKDIHVLVSSFYVDVRADELIGPVFNRAIPEALWPTHIERLTDFWETVVFGGAKYSGNPKARHASVDRMENGEITQAHFGRWLQLWFAKVDELYIGSRAEQVKARARLMSTGLFLGILASRKDVR